MQKGKYLRTKEHKKKMSDVCISRGIHAGEKNGMFGKSPWIKNKHHSDKTRKKISDKNIGRKFSEEHKRNLSINHADFSGKKHPQFGSHLSEDHKEKIRKKLIGIPLSEDRKKKLFNWKGKKHSIKTRIKMSNSCKGDKRWNWKGGITPENKTIRKSIEIRLWREAVFIRDSYICQKCNLKGGNLEVHHIQNFAEYPELRFAIDNGITLCKKCHKKFHKIYGQRKNTKKQLDEFKK